MPMVPDRKATGTVLPDGRRRDDLFSADDQLIPALTTVYEYSRVWKSSVGSQYAQKTW